MAFQQHSEYIEAHFLRHHRPSHLGRPLPFNAALYSESDGTSLSNDYTAALAVGCQVHIARAIGTLGEALRHVTVEGEIVTEAAAAGAAEQGGGGGGGGGSGGGSGGAAASPPCASPSAPARPRAEAEAEQAGGAEPMQLDGESVCVPCASTGCEKPAVMACPTSCSEGP